MERESGKIVPALISQNAWEVAFAIDNEINALLYECGLVRIEGKSVLSEVIARMVQLAINRSHEE